MSRILVRGSTAFKPIINEFGPGFSSIYHARRLSDLSKPSFTRLVEDWNETTEKIINGLRVKYKPYPKGTLLDLVKPEVMEVKTEDIELSKADEFGQITIASKDGVLLRYGKKGVAASNDINPRALLTEEVLIPRGVNILDIEKHRPFLIETKKPLDAFAATDCQLEKTYSHEENIQRYSMSLLCAISADDAKRLSIKIQDKIFSDYKKESFYEEVTSKVYQPTRHNKSSGTLMNFESTNYKVSMDKTTDIHYHPGERSLLIVTTNRPSGVTLNFCGVCEDPDKRADCAVDFPFPKNSITVLNFAPYTHHKFHGDFVCMSIHPREGVNIIEAVKSGTLPRGFLESATVFSATVENQKKWNLSLPVGKDKSREKGSTSRD